jgi:hypothetical protein
VSDYLNGSLDVWTTDNISISTQRIDQALGLPQQDNVNNALVQLLFTNSDVTAFGVTNPQLIQDRASVVRSLINDYQAQYVFGDIAYIQSIMGC